MFIVDISRQGFNARERLSLRGLPSHLITPDDMEMAAAFATAEMLDEIHHMLRVLLRAMETPSLIEQISHDERINEKKEETNE